jgi:hypothetical protein
MSSSDVDAAAPPEVDVPQLPKDAESLLTT